MYKVLFFAEILGSKLWAWFIYETTDLFVELLIRDKFFSNQHSAGAGFSLRNEVAGE